MPAVQPGTDLFETTATVRFLRDCQQQALSANHSKIASFGFTVAALQPGTILAQLQRPQQRHFYYDPPRQPVMVGAGTVIECKAAGTRRFHQAQTFIENWRSHFCHKDLTLSTSQKQGRLPRGYFFCSATFAGGAEQTESGFEPVHVFVPAVQVITTDQASRICFNALILPESNLSAIAHQAHSCLEQLLTAKAVKSHPPVPSAAVLMSSAVESDLANFERSVSAALAQVKKGAVRKVVLADVMDVRSPEPFDQVRSLQALRQNHPDCTVFSVGNGRGQAFIGASPERLLSISKGQLLTDALAGSASRGVNPNADIDLANRLFHSDKERYEHRVVVEYIAQQLRSLGLIPKYDPAPQLLRLLHIQHLHTPIRATLNRAEPVSPLAILSKLHPTPAVAGLPVGAACHLISQQETFDRGLYASPIGWIDTHNNSEFMVGIRSALLDGAKARLYAGAGIVRGSEPKKELAEIKLKLQTLLNALIA